MTFAEAMEEVRNGKKVRRARWQRDGYRDYPIVEMYLDIIDLVADDWEVAQ